MKNQKSKNKQQAKIGKLSFTDKGWEDYLFWQKEDPKIVDEINNLLDECLISPFKGTEKPEPLSENLTGFWSRRITHEHRLVYLPEDGVIYVVSCRYHYAKH
jgi:toxin YoeB